MPAGQEGPAVCSLVHAIFLVFRAEKREFETLINPA
jgi:hypothetical protein